MALAVTADEWIDAAPARHEYRADEDMMLRPIAAAVDVRGRRVRLGAHVRVLKIAPWLLARLDAPDKVRVRSMVDQVFEVEEIDEWGRPRVVKAFPGGNQHSLALDTCEMELVLPNQKGKRRGGSESPIAKMR